MTGMADQATDEAAGWLVMLEEDPNDMAVLARFQSWLNAAPENRQAWADMAEIYDLMGKLPPMHADAWHDARKAAKPATQSPFPWRRPAQRLARVAAGFLVLLLAAFAVPPLETYLRADFRTGVGEIRAVTLADGSIVRLGPNAALEQLEWTGERRFRLLAGDAFFEVTRDPDRPFRVEAAHGRVTVLGTAFELRSGAALDRVAVRKGRVSFAPKDQAEAAQRPLAPGDWASLDADGRRQAGHGAPEDVAAWLDGRVVARDRPLAEVVEELGNYFPGVILLADSALGTKRVTGSYNTADPIAALRALAGAHGGTVHSLSPWILILS